MKMTPIIDFEWEVIKEDDADNEAINPLTVRKPCCLLDELF